MRKQEKPSISNRVTRVVSKALILVKNGSEVHGYNLPPEIKLCKTVLTKIYRPLLAEISDDGIRKCVSEWFFFLRPNEQEVLTMRIDDDKNIPEQAEMRSLSKQRIQAILARSGEKLQKTLMLRVKK